MIRLTSKTLSVDTTNHLDTKQTDVNSQVDFVSKAKRAGTLWDGKTGSIVGQVAFDEIKSKLTAMCVGVEGCNYCEGNEARDIEHIYPKSLFPERAFKWSNYLLACKTCNTGEKLDEFAIFVPNGSATKFEIPRASKPVNDDAVLINPREENPEDYLWLDIEYHTFRFRAKPDNDDPRCAIKAEYTIKLLALNDRDNLVAARKAAAHYYLDRLKQYIDVRDSNDFDTLDACVQDPELIDESISFETEKARILISIKKDILTYAHPTVWLELKRQRDRLKRTKKLFDQAQEALTW